VLFFVNQLTTSSKGKRPITVILFKKMKKIYLN